MTIDEELAKLEENLRRLRVEYEAYFNGGLPRAPRDTVFRVETVVKRFSSDQSEMSFGQRFRFNQLAQRYAVYNDLWRKRLRMMEEGREEPERRERLDAPENVFRVVASDPVAEPEKVDQLFGFLMDAKKQMGEPAPPIDPSVFANFIREKTAELKQRLGCERVEFRVSMEDGRVKLKAARG
ncbi:MAG TPA: MXAN_5187 C-terminal domain-containing protein [Terriglobia bacterium]